MKVCKVEWCDKETYRKDYCQRHYNQVLKWGEIRRSRGDKNEYVKQDEYAEIILYDKEYKEKVKAKIDIEDIEKCKPYKWVCRNDGYVSAKINGKGIKLHRFIVETPKGMHTDHINRDRLDNRKCNLRICTQSENNKNKRRYKKNKTGKSGVQYRKADDMYEVGIKYDGVDYYLGIYKNLEDAIKAREEAEIKLYDKILDR